MTATYSTRMKLIIPAGTDAADINTIIANWNKLDGTSGLLLCTSSTRPVTNLFPGLWIKETDTGKHYYLDGSGSWAANVYSGGVWVEDFYSVAPVGLNTTTFAQRKAGDGSQVVSGVVAWVADSNMQVPLMTAGTYTIYFFLPYFVSGSAGNAQFRFKSTGTYASSVGPAYGIDSRFSSGSSTGDVPFFNSDWLTLTTFNNGVNVTGFSVQKYLEGRVRVEVTGTGNFGFEYRPTSATNDVLTLGEGAYMTATKVI